MSNPTPGQGCVLKVTISASPTAIAKNTKFGPINIKRTVIDFTGLADTMEASLVSSLERGDEIAFAGWWDASDSTHAYLKTSVSGSVLEVWTALYADTGAATISFSGYLTEYSVGEANIEGLVEVSGKIKRTTVITLTP